MFGGNDDRALGSAETFLKVKKDVENIQLVLRCGICCSTVKNAQVPNCHHAFCEDCLKECFKKLKGFRCPVCARPINRRSCAGCPTLDTAVERYLKMAKCFKRACSSLHLPKEAQFFESQALLTQDIRSQPVVIAAVSADLAHKRASRSSTADRVSSLRGDRKRKLKELEALVKRERNDLGVGDTRPDDGDRVNVSGRNAQKVGDSDTIDGKENLSPMAAEGSDVAVVGPSRIDQDLVVEKASEGGNTLGETKIGALSGGMKGTVPDGCVTAGPDSRTERGIGRFIVTDRRCLLIENADDGSNCFSNRATVDFDSVIEYVADSAEICGENGDSDVASPRCDVSIQGDQEPEPSKYDVPLRGELQTVNGCCRMSTASSEDKSVQVGEDVCKTDVSMMVGCSVWDVQEREMQTVPPDVMDSETQCAKWNISEELYNAVENVTGGSAVSRIDALLGCLPWLPSFLNVEAGVLRSLASADENVPENVRPLCPDSLKRFPSEDLFTEAHRWTPDIGHEDNAHQDEDDERTEPMYDVEQQAAQQTAELEKPSKETFTESVEDGSVIANDEDETDVVEKASQALKKDAVDIVEDSLKPPPPSPSPEIVLLVSGVSDLACLKLLNRFYRMFPNVRKCSELKEDVSHLVMMNSQGRLCKSRSVKYAFAIANGSAVVSRAWIEQSLKLNAIADMKEFLIDGDVDADPTSNAVQRSMAQPGSLFKGMGFFIPPPFFYPKAVSAGLLRKIISLAGGVCVSFLWELELPKFTKRFVIFSPTDTDCTDEAMKFELDTQAPVVLVDWVLDSVCQYRTLDTSVYRVARGAK